MKDTYVTFETAVLAKKKGFNWSCSYEPFLANWNDTPSTNSYDRVSLPTQSLLQKWLREKHQIHIVMIPTPENHYTFKLMDIGVEDIERPPYNEVEANDYDTYEACLEAALQKCFIFIK